MAASADLQFRFEGAGLAARSLKAQHDIDVEKHRLSGSSMVRK
jgi:hypothetical protein